MKILKTSVVLLFVALCLGNAMPTQAQKFGYINSEELMAAMPEQAKAKAELETLTDNLQAQLKTMNTDLQTKFADYQKLMKDGTASDLIRSNKEAELQELQNRIQQFQQAATQNVQKKQQDLLKPIFDKAQKAIEEVGKENAYTYIFDLSGGSVLFHGEGSTDVLPLVKKKLGIQ